MVLWNADVSQEVGILKSLNYDRNIVQFYGACLQEGSDPMLVCEYMEGGSSTLISAHSSCMALHVK
jgi:serine/threonine protein kinase